MIPLLRLFLLLGAVFGLLWQGVAYAAPPCAEMQQPHVAASADGPDAMDEMADCMDTKKQSGENGPPCKDMKAGCFAMAGCTPLVGLGSMPFSDPASLNAASDLKWLTSPVLFGRSEAPIPHPPSDLG